MKPLTIVLVPRSAEASFAAPIMASLVICKTVVSGISWPGYVICLSMGSPIKNPLQAGFMVIIDTQLVKLEAKGLDSDCFSDLTLYIRINGYSTR